MMKALAAVCFSGALAQAGGSPPGAAAEPSPAPATAASPEVLRLPAGSELEIELVDKLSSATSHLADRFAIRLVQPISSHGVTVVAAGATGQGEVIDAAHAGMSGGQGKLVISARFLDLNGRPVRVRGMTLMAASGKSRVGLAMGASFVPYVGLGAMLIKGGEIEIPAGARATVRLAEDIELPVKAAIEGGETK